MHWPQWGRCLSHCQESVKPSTAMQKRHREKRRKDRAPTRRLTVRQLAQFLEGFA
ncbi:hypothetical protein BJX68DRAFT_114039 [Aspergillus pseudodeflectus]|uniref:Uncharacterized protein n=1 Tax=Aspergillus pseudodeflectus TaxID=176178 RepID=A0ABR4L4A8_9EURO